MTSLESLIRVGGVLHLGILLASALTPSVLDWRSELRRLSDLSRHVVWVHGAFIVLVIVGFGVISLLNARDLAAGSALARSVCGFVAVFWLGRLAIQLFLFDARPYLRRPALKLGYHGLTATFLYLALVYGCAAALPTHAM